MTTGGGRSPSPSIAITKTLLIPKRSGGRLNSPGDGLAVGTLGEGFPILPTCAIYQGDLLF